MASLTPRLGLAIFDFGDQLDAPLNVQKEIDRFMVIDKQLWGIYNIFSNGVVSGWLVSDNGFTAERGISVAISPGTGIMRYLASETIFPGVVDSLPPNAVINIYAVLQGSTAEDRAVAFAYSSTSFGDSGVLLAQVTTGQSSVVSINNSVRQLIGFREIIRQEIDAHRHRGTPSKIDLRTETRNQLPGSKIESVDADKITSGVLGKERNPLLDHEELQYNGLLTHAQLDSFVNTLKTNNKELLGEIASVNLLKQILFLKYNYVDLDENFVNELAIIPGLSSDDFIDFEASTAHIDLDSHCISGKPPRVGQFVDIDWDTQTSFSNAFRSVNLNTVNGSVYLQRDLAAKEVIENFETVSAAGADVSGFVKSNTVITDNLYVKAEAASTLHVEGFYSGRFSPNRQYRALFTKTFSTARDWSNLDQLIAQVKSVSTSHGPVFCYFINDDGTTKTQSSVFLLLAADEVTSNPDDTLNDFEERSFTLQGETRSSVTQFVIFTDDTSDEFQFYIDNIVVQNNSLFMPQGSITLRYTTSADVLFHSLFFEGSTPDGTQILVRARSANAPSLLSRAAFTLPVHSGDVIALPGTDVEIEVTLVTNDTSTTPVLDSVKLRMLVDSESQGFDIQNETDWVLGTTRNIDITPTTGDLAELNLSAPINVDGLSFSYLGAVREIDDANVGVFGFSGVNMPISPIQALSWATSPLKKFADPVSVERLLDKTFLVADRNNDRVLLCDSVGNLVKGFGSVTKTDNEFYPLVSCYNPTNGILTVVFSRSVDRTSINLSKISVFIGSTEISLTSSDTVVPSTKNQQILEILLTSDKIAQLIDATNVYVSIKTGSFTQTIGTNVNAAALLGVNGIPVFIGDFTYMDGILHPVHAKILENGNWIVANSSIIYTGQSSSTTGTSTSLGSNPSSVVVTVGATTSVTISGGTAPYTVATSPNPATATATFSGTTLTVSGVAAGSTSVLVKDSATSPLTVNIPITCNAVTTTGQTQTSSPTPSIVEFNPTTLDKDFTSNVISFSDFSLGSIYEQSEDRIIVAGVYKDSAALPVALPSSTTDTSITEQQAFRQAAVVALGGYKGIVAIIDKPSSNIVFSYYSPDGIYASDIDVDPDGNLVVAESSFSSASGRVVVLDNSGNIIRVFGNKMFNAVNDAKSVNVNHILISV